MVLLGKNLKQSLKTLLKLAIRKLRFPLKIWKPEIDNSEDSRLKRESGQLMFKFETSQKSKEYHYLTLPGNYLNSSLPHSWGGILNRVPKADRRSSIYDDRGCFPGDGCLRRVEFQFDPAYQKL